MGSAGSEVDVTHWDWLQGASDEAESYMSRLLAESGIRPHDISARVKTIRSFRRKSSEKGYRDPIAQVTDTVALRVIAYSETDKERSCAMIRERFAILPGEDRNPEKETSRRGYACHHFVITGEAEGSDSAWLVAHGPLQRYFETFGGLEIQVRTVAAHAWAEFEHARRYKGAQYEALSAEDRRTIDQLFGAAADARSCLDGTFVAIDRILARPAAGEDRSERTDETADDVPAPATTVPAAVEELTAEALRAYLDDRYPEDQAPSARGIDFAVELVRACRLTSVDALDEELSGVDSDQVRDLMDLDVPVTSVRRMDDDLLARFQESYIARTGAIGSARSRPDQLSWRFDRLRGKTRAAVYTVQGASTTAALREARLPGSRMVREVVRIVAEAKGVEAVLVDGATRLDEGLPARSRAIPVTIPSGGTVWVATNLGRRRAEKLVRRILGGHGDLDLRVLCAGEVIADGMAA